MHSYSSVIPNLPHTNTQYNLLSLGDAPQDLSTWEYPYVGQPLFPYTAHNTSLDNPQQSTTLLQSSLGPHPQSQERIELGPIYPPLPENNSFGPPAEAATTSRRREPVDEPESVDESEPEAPR